MTKSTVATAQSQRVPTVLCIDDDPDVSRMIELRLRSFEVKCNRAFFGTQGIWESLCEKPDAIVLDFNMPQGRGDYVLETLRRNAKTADIPVIVLTGQPDLEPRLKRLGAQGFLKKPVHIGLLLAELSKYVDLRPISPGSDAA